MWGAEDSCNLDALANGADGFFAALCEEGASMGHACTAVALANLARLGNKYVTRRWNMKCIAEAARAVTRLTTGKRIHDRQLVYGPRAIEAVFSFGGLAGGVKDMSFDRDGDGDIDEIDHFSLADMLGIEDPPVRLHILSSPQQFADRLTQCFGESADFTPDLGEKLLKQLHANLNNEVYAEYTSPFGLAKLYEQTVGSLTEAMKEAVAKGDKEELQPWMQQILASAEATFKGLSVNSKDVKLSFSEFTSNYLESYFEQHNHLASYLNNSQVKVRAKQILRNSFDTNKDGRIGWEEWRTWKLWALRSFAEEVQSPDDLHAVIVRHMILPQLLKKA